MSPLSLLPLALTATLSTLAALTPGAAQAATLDLDAAGKLLGARGVVVNGTAYDVQFRDGSCAALHNGCDAAGDFVFHSNAEANAASRALLDQVFNAFATIDLDPKLTRGCETSGYFFQGQAGALCWAHTAYAVLPQIGYPEPQVATVIVANDSRDAWDLVPSLDVNVVFLQSTDLGANGFASKTFAVWSAAGGEPPTASVPEPGSLALALASLGLLGGLKRAGRGR